MTPVPRFVRPCAQADVEWRLFYDGIRIIWMISPHATAMLRSQPIFSVFKPSDYRMLTQLRIARKYADKPALST
jgi:hypothetical protein